MRDTPARRTYDEWLRGNLSHEEVAERFHVAAQRWAIERDNNPVLTPRSEISALQPMASDRGGNALALPLIFSFMLIAFGAGFAVGWWAWS